MAATTESMVPAGRELTREEALAFFESEVHRLLGISGEEFLRRLDNEEYADVIDTPGHWQIAHLEMLSHVVR